MKVIILAGGLGTRISEETTVKPKPMVEIGNHPIIWHIMKYYSSYNYNDFVIALGYKGHIIKEYFNNYSLLNGDLNINLKTGDKNLINKSIEDWNIGLYETGLNSMTGGRLLNLKKLFNPGDTFMLTYGDGLSNVDIKKLVDFHFSHGKIATMTTVRPPARFGTLDMKDNGQVVSFKEKPQTSEGWINGGFFVLNYKIFDYLENNFTIFEKEPLENLAINQELMAYKHYDFWKCMDTVRDRDMLNEIWESKNIPWKKY